MKVHWEFFFSLGDSSCCRRVVQLSHMETPYKASLYCSSSTSGPPPSSHCLFWLPVASYLDLIVFSRFSFHPCLSCMESHMHGLRSLGIVFFFFFTTTKQIQNISLSTLPFPMCCLALSLKSSFFFPVRQNVELCLCNAGSFIAHKCGEVLWAPGVGLGVLAGFWNRYDYWAGPAYCWTIKTKQLFNSWQWWDITLEIW